MNIRKHSLRASIRAFRIWQKLGVFPWAKPKKKSAGKGGFSKGAFDSIPFLNDDAKRTFVHLLLRPGYMIRDYINGQHERFLAPLTSLIIFYAFFAMLVSIVKPDYRAETAGKKEKIKIERQINSTDCGAAIKRYNEMEEKVERLEAEAAVASKNYENESKFTEMEVNSSVDKELEELKEKLNARA